MYTHLDIIKPIELVSKDGPGGRFYKTPQGKHYPSITTILGDEEKKWLIEWRESMGAKKAEKVSNAARERGTAVHLMIERLLKNEEDPTRDQHFSHITEFNTLRLFLKKVDNIITQESAMWSDIMKVAGRVDCIGDYEKKLSVIDFKTSNGAKRQSQVEDYFLQTTGYALMFNEMYGINIENIVIIMSVEKEPVPFIFKQKVEDHIEPLLNRISAYHEARKSK